MLAFRVWHFQYFLLVSPQEWLGRLDLNRWILEALERRFQALSYTRRSGNVEHSLGTVQALLAT